MTRTTTRCGFAVRQHLDAAAVRHGIQRVVDQIRPDLIEFAGETAHARQVRLPRSIATAADFCPRLRLEHGDGVAETLGQIHRLGHHAPDPCA